MQGGGLKERGASGREIEDALRSRVDQLVPELLAGAMRDGAYWSCGSVNGDAGTQMKINRQGPKRGVWTDFSAAPGTDEYSGDLLKLICVVHFGGWSRGDEARSKAMKWAEGWLGWENIDPGKLEKIRREADVRAKQADEEARRQAEGRLKSATAMWNGAMPIRGTPAEAYLAGRGIDFARLGRVPGSLRFLPDCWCYIRRSKHPAMIACIMRFGAFAGVHRTYLDVTAGKGGPVKVLKVAMDETTRTMRFARPGDRKPKSYKLSLGDYRGGCIPLSKGACGKTLQQIDAGTPVYVSEGIEDGLSVAVARPDLRIVAGVALANMGALELPPQAGPLVFIGQNDALDGKAVEAFERAIARQQQAARMARRPLPQTFFPDPRFKDFNDQLLGREMA